MSDKKNIDRLFQEKFKDFEADPPEFVWENIREALEDKKKKRVIPLWFRLGGVAAVIAIMLLLGNLYLNGWGSTTVAPAVTTSPDATKVQSPLKALPTDVNAKGNNVIDRRDNPAQPANRIVNSTVKDEETTIKPGINNTSVKNAPVIRTKAGAGTKDDALVNYNPNKVENKSTSPLAKYDPSQQNDAVVTNSTTLNKGRGKAGSKQHNAAVAETNSESGNNASKKQVVVTNKNNTSPNNSVISSLHKINTAGKGSDPVNQAGQPYATNNNADNSKSKGNVTDIPGNIFSETNKSVAATVNKDSQNTAADKQGSSARNVVTSSAQKSNDNTLTNTENTTIINAAAPILSEAVAETKIDTTAVAPENELEKLLKEQQKGKYADKDKDLADNVNKSKWNIKPQLAPVFYNSLSSGSPIDGQFASNTKSYDNDLSVGLGINYAVTNRISIRSGVNAVNLNYATQGVEFYASLNEQTNNVAARTSNANIVVQDQGTTNRPEVFFADKLPTETFNGSMVQRTGYIEVPVEMSYALLNKKFGIDIIGGVSTLFLNQNNVSVVSTQGYSTNVGQAQNLNNIHFSTNVGIGFKYRFFKSFEANFEPMFKYQVNTFSRDAGNFKPYFIGLYSGISFSF